MPYIQCDIRSGLSIDQRTRLAAEIARVVHESLGAPLPYIHVAVREVPGETFVESGVLNSPRVGSDAHADRSLQEGTETTPI
jgi:phenylpyruvate tautomerase PptA (4-oxalocrotonate tautomerase family)